MILPLPADPLRWLAADETLNAEPWTAWSTANRLAVGAKGAIDLVNPRTGVRTALVTAAQFGAAGRAAKIALSDYERPTAVNGALSRLAYLDGGDLLVYDVRLRKLRRVDRGRIPAVAFSPDGTKLAYGKGNDLYAWSAESGVSTRLTTAERPRLLNGVLSWLYGEEIFSRAEGGFAWSPDSKRIAYLQTDESPVRPSAFVGFDGPPSSLSAQTYPFAGGPNPKVRVGVVAATGGSTVWLQSGPSEYVTRFGWTPKGEPWVLSLDRPQTRADLWKGDAATGLGRSLLSDTNPQWVNLTDDLRFLADGRVLMNSQRDGYDRLYLWGADGGLLGAVTPPRRSLAHPLSATHGLRWVDPKGGSILFASGDPQRFESQLARVRTDGGSYAELTTEPGTHLTKVSPDGQSYVDVQSRLDEPPRVTLRSIDGRTIAVLGDRRPLPEGYQKARMLRIGANDGFPLPAYVRMPEGFDPAKRYPTVAYVYGAPGLPEVTDAWKGTQDQILTSAGYVVFVVDPRSATALDERLARAAKGRAIGASEGNDLVDAVRWLKRQPYVDPARVGLWGWSTGGSTTLLGLTRSKEFAAGVAVAPVTDWRFYDTFYAERLMGRPAENPKGYNQTAFWREARNLSGRLLLMYGTHDDNVHPMNAERFLDALIRAGKTAEVLPFPGRGHNLDDPAAYATVYRTMLDFFGRSL